MSSYCSYLSVIGLGRAPFGPSAEACRLHERPASSSCAHAICDLRLTDCVVCLAAPCCLAYCSARSVWLTALLAMFGLLFAMRTVWRTVRHADSRTVWLLVRGLTVCGLTVVRVSLRLNCKPTVSPGLTVRIEVCLTFWLCAANFGSPRRPSSTRHDEIALPSR